MLEKHFKDISATGQRVKAAAAPAITTQEKQVAFVIATIEKTLMGLIEDGMMLKSMIMGLFYFWIIIEARAHDISEEKLNQEESGILGLMQPMTTAIHTLMNSLPDIEASADLHKLGEQIDELKQFLPEGDFVDREAALAEPALIRKQVTKVNTAIAGTVNELIDKAIHPQYIGNILCMNWIRLSTIAVGTLPEAYYQKIEYYFDKVIPCLRRVLLDRYGHKQLPTYHKDLTKQKQHKQTKQSAHHMPPSHQKAYALIASIDTKVNKIWRRGGDDEALLKATSEFMDDIWIIMKTLPEQALQSCYQQYRGFARLMELLTLLAKGIRNGKIEA